MTEISQGNVVKTINNYVQEPGFDMIVAGTKGNGALEALLMGSVTRAS